MVFSEIKKFFTDKTTKDSETSKKLSNEEIERLRFLKFDDGAVVVPVLISEDNRKFKDLRTKKEYSVVLNDTRIDIGWNVTEERDITRPFLQRQSRFYSNETGQEIFLYDYSKPTEDHPFCIAKKGCVPVYSTTPIYERVPLGQRGVNYNRISDIKDWPVWGNFRYVDLSEMMADYKVSKLTDYNIYYWAKEEEYSRLEKVAKRTPSLNDVFKLANRMVKCDAEVERSR
ncbi:MAG: hypothetical protein IKQ31_01195 [Clostridia bacterium]|nr:hypothetical protein [Clostridia bacterium]